MFLRGCRRSNSGGGQRGGSVVAISEMSSNFFVKTPHFRKSEIATPPRPQRNEKNLFGASSYPERSENALTMFSEANLYP